MTQRDPYLVCYGCAHAASGWVAPGRPSGERPCHFCTRNPEADLQPQEWYDGSKPASVPMDCYHSLDMMRQIGAWVGSHRVEGA